MSAAPSAREHWWLDHTNLAALLVWMVDHDEIGTEVQEIAYFLGKPWKWTAEWNRMNGATTEVRDSEALKLVRALEATESMARGLTSAGVAPHEALRTIAGCRPDNDPNDTIPASRYP